MDLITNITLKKDNFLCGICQNLVCVPLETQCGHLFCQACISKYDQIQAARQQELRCPLCRTPIRKDLVRPFQNNRMAFGLLQQLKVRCPHAEGGADDKNLNSQGNYTCPWIGTYEQLEKHKKTCLARQIECLFCNQSLKFHEFDFHFMNQCKKRLISCCTCNEKISKDQLESHMHCKHREGEDGGGMSLRFDKLHF